MKTAKNKTSNLNPPIIATLVLALCALQATALVSVSGQVSAKTPAATKESPKRLGYLNKPQPSGLRFAPLPKPPVAYLPPLPITFDPQPVFSPDFAQPGTEFPLQAEGTTSAQPITSPPASVPITEIASNLKGVKQGKIPVDTGNTGTVSPQMLVRFFESGKPMSIEIPINQTVDGPLSFRIPARQDKPTSSATYEVK